MALLLAVKYVNIIILVLDKGSVNCLDTGPRHSSKSVCAFVRGGQLRPDLASLDSPRGQSVEVQQPRRELVTVELLLLRDVLSQGIWHLTE